MIADILLDQGGWHLALLAVDRGPFPFVVELDFRAVGKLHVIVGLLEKVLVDLDHAHLGFREMLVEHLASLLRQVLTIDGVLVEWKTDSERLNGANQCQGNHHKFSHNRFFFELHYIDPFRLTGRLILSCK